MLLLNWGCATRGHSELLEAQLRQQEDQLFELQSRLAQTQSELDVARKEAEGLRTQLASQGADPILPEQANVLYRAQGIQFNTLLTGGLDTDGVPGDDLVSAVLVPHDADGELLKLPGKIEIELLDLAQPTESQRLGQWEFSLDESRNHWHRGFIGSGYLFKLPWQQQPTSSDLLLHARLTTPDQRQFDTTTQVQVELGSGGQPTPRRDLLLGDGHSIDGTRNGSDQAIRQTSFHRFESNMGAQPEAEPLALEPDEPLPSELSPLQTSDSWTDATIPRYR